MKITNNRTYDIYLGYIGQKVLASSTLIVDDGYASNESLQYLVTQGDVSLSDFSVSNSGMENISAVEFNGFAKGLFRIPSWSKTGTVTKGTGYTLTGTETGPFDFTRYNTLTLKFDSLHTVSIAFSAIQDITGVVSTVNAAISAYGIASEDTGTLKIASYATGPNSLVEVITTSPLSCHHLFGLTTVGAATGTVATVSFSCKNPTGQGIVDLPLVVHLYTTAGGAVDCAEYMLQRAATGTMFGAEATIYTGSNGAVTFEVGCDDTITEAGCFMDVIIPDDYFLAVKPIARLEIS